jgi:hypothetical protein
MYANACMRVADMPESILNIYICVCIYVYIYVYVYVYVYVYTYIYVMYNIQNVYVAHTHTHTHTHVCVCVCVYVFMLATYRSCLISVGAYHVIDCNTIHFQCTFSQTHVCVFMLSTYQ